MMSNIIKPRTTEPQYIDILSHKGGVGSTVVASALAAQLAAEDHKVFLVDKSPHCDTAGTFGVVMPDVGSWTEATRNIFIHHSPTAGTTVMDDEPDFIIFDWGTHFTEHVPVDDSRWRVCVVRNDYMVLRNTIHAGEDKTANQFVLIKEPERVLNERDVASVLGTSTVDLVQVDLDPAVGRAMDAGLLSMRHTLVDLSQITSAVGVGR